MKKMAILAAIPAVVLAVMVSLFYCGVECVLVNRYYDLCYLSHSCENPGRRYAVAHGEYTTMTRPKALDAMTYTDDVNDEGVDVVYVQGGKYIWTRPIEYVKAMDLFRPGEWHTISIPIFPEYYCCCELVIADRPPWVPPTAAGHE